MMTKATDFPEQLYLDEIETWRKASQVHAKSAIAQYKKVTQGLEEFHFEKTRNEAILNHLNDSVIVINDQHEIVIWNQATAKLFNFTAKQAVGQDFDILMETLFPELLNLMQERLSLHHNDNEHHILTFNNMHLSCKFGRIDIHGSPYQLVLLEDTTDLIKLQHMLEDEKAHLEERIIQRTEELEQQIQQKKHAQLKLEKMALTDTLTLLPNRAAFAIQLQHALDRSQIDNYYEFALLFIDLDGFKNINDTLGHHAGDELLLCIAKRMQAIVRGSDVIARIGGDEFITLLHNPGDEQKIRRIAQTLLNELAKPVELGHNQKMSISASIGIWYGSANTIDNDASRVLSMADLAMYEAKRRGKNRYEIFSDDMWQQMQEKVSLTTKLEQAFEKKEFLPYLQPICDIDGNILGAEVLSRWCHDGEMIPPGKFIPVLEQRGLIRDYTNHLIETIIEKLQENESLPCVSVNLSIQQFYDENFLPFLDRLFYKMPKICKRLSFEITESMFNHDPELVTGKIHKLRERGFRIYIDDFGTGYSSFAYIRNFTADVIKIDREFVMGIVENEKDLHLLKGMIALMSSLNMEIVIEGVETREQLEKIRSLKHEVKIQGFLFHKPMPVDSMLELLDTPVVFDT